MDLFRPDSSGGPPVPVKGHGDTVGISQIKTWIRCPRAWFLGSVAKIETPPKTHLVLGSAVHACNEGYIRGCDPPFAPDCPPEVREKAARIHRRGVNLLPPPRSQSIGGIEHRIRHWLPLSGRFAGYLALYQGTVDLWEWHPFGDEWGILLTDHKTAASLRYVDDPAALAKDVQTLTYSWALSVELAKSGVTLPGIRMRKNYFPTKEPPPFQPFPVEADADSATVAKMGDWLCETASQMAEDAFKSEPEIRQNFDACKDFGGCEFQNRCHPPESIFDRVFQIEESRKVNAMNAQQRQDFVTAATGGTAAPPSPFDGLSEAQIRLIYTMQIDASAPGTFTRAEMLPRVKHHFTNASAASVDQWVAYAQKNAPSVNPPEQAKAGPASAARESEGAAGEKNKSTPNVPRKGSDTAGSPEEVAIRKAFRDVSPKTFRSLIAADKIAAVREEYSDLRDQIAKGAKPAANIMVNAAARELLARGVTSGEQAAAWIASNAAPVKPVPIRAEQLPTDVASAMRSAGLVPYGDQVSPEVRTCIDAIPERDRWAILRGLGKSDAEIKIPGTDARTWAAGRLGELFGNGLDSLRGWATWAAGQPRGWIAGQIDSARPFLERCDKTTFATLADWARISDRARAYFADPASIHGPRPALAHEICCDLQERAMTMDAQFNAWVQAVTGIDVSTYTPAPEVPTLPPPPAPVPVAAPPVPSPPPPAPVPVAVTRDPFEGFGTATDLEPVSRRSRIADHLRALADLIEAGI